MSIVINKKKRNKPKISREDLIDSLQVLDFSVQNGEDNIWIKKYPKHDYLIKIKLNEFNPEKSIIDYGSKIKLVRKTTSNFSQTESIVVLECVNRLLEKGYRPDKIVLEKDWPLGHKTKGFLDILVLDDEDKSFLMIECKTHGEEHQKEKAKMFEDGGQLFSYLIQEKTTKYLCLYSSLKDNNNFKYESDIVTITDSIRDSNNQQDAFEKWVPQFFETKGVLEPNVNVYDVKFTGILKKELEDLKQEEGGLIYNQFAEILRRNVVSDKTNAFNKIFNLFLCKIVDEVETDNEDETKFQWKKNEKAEEVMLRLNDLYKKGMDKYLDLKISAVTDDELNRELEKVNTEDGKVSIRNLFIQQKLYTGNEFAFKEVFDKKTFELNSLVVKEVVKILERKTIKYQNKQQFLGDFFERLLNTGIKQEAGQFFTPIPITSFICKSLPIEQIIINKNENREEKFLPYIIDYASGSGHFLTEVMAEINKYVEKIDEKFIKGGERAKMLFNSQKNFYLWAKEYIYGIEKDYRLAKTTKISTFLNGDGDANIIFGDGLDNFEESTEYRGLLKVSENNMDNGQFDVLIANPPYSVSGFKITLKNGKKSFSLFDRFSNKSSEIECLFIERAKQLIKEGGVAAIILPSSVLTNGGIYTNARDILFRFFEFKAIVELGRNTFMATNTNTVVLFLKRISPIKYETTQKIINVFISTKKDVAVNGIERAFTKYAEVVYGLDLKEYITLFNRKPSNKLVESEIFDTYAYHWKNKNKIDKDYKEIKEILLFDETIFKYIVDTEKQKMLNFFISYNQKIILSKTPESNNKEKSLLGYEFSDRRGYEGIKIYKDSRGKIVSKLYNEDDLKDSSKLNSYILKNFKNESLNDKDIVDDIRESVGVRYLYELVDYSLPSFEGKITLSLKKKLKFNTKYPLEKLGVFANYIQGLTYEKDDEVQQETNNRIVTASNIDLATSNLDLIDEKFLRKDIKIDSEKKIKKDDVFICTSSGSIRHLGKVAIIDANINAYFGGFCAVLRTNDHLLPKYLYSILNTQEFRNYVELRKGSNINNLGKDYLLSFRLPVPPPEIQKEVVKDLDKIDEEVNKIKTENINLKEEINTKFSVIFSQYKDSFTKIENIKAMVQRGRSAQYGISNIQIIKSGQIRGYYNFDFSEKYYASENYILDQRKLEDEDLLINSTGVGTAGRVNLF
ncbi:MAG TPA: hypothetical protein DEG92_09975, partial [Rikenellaceae bacterium]|nr:hypothetical protein [Rikenellaceae bacterium]